MLDLGLPSRRVMGLAVRRGAGADRIGIRVGARTADAASAARENENQSKERYRLKHEPKAKRFYSPHQ
jgi:hypothetical protein